MAKAGNDMQTSDYKISSAYLKSPTSTHANMKLAEKEQKAVILSKLLVILVLLLSVGVMATLTHVFISKGEYHDFEVQFKNYASQVITVSQKNAETTLEAVEAFSDMVSSYADDTNKSWPYVTIPDFAAQGSALVNITNGKIVAFAPLVSGAARYDWEEFSQKNFVATAENGIKYEKLNISARSIFVSPSIFTVDLQTYAITNDDSSGPYLAAWQVAPFMERTSTQIVNYNFLSDRRVRNAYYLSAATRSAALSFFAIEGRLDSNVIQPIFKKVSKDKSDQTPVGIIWLAVDWINYFQNLLPANANGIVAVLRSTCGDSISYQINGIHATLLGNGDRHQSKYEHLEARSDFLRIKTKESVPSVDDECVPELKLHLYPSDELRDAFRTNNATIFSALVVAVFLFTSMVFIIYDTAVRRRQDKVMDRVLRQDLIVSDIFPASFRDRLYGIGAQKEEQPKRTSLSDAGKAGLEESPLADLFPSATVLFANVCGFTAWCSAREPSQVFLLLESIYGAFDKIAKYHKVFKVETIGDCYVAVAGLPEQLDEHSVVMAKFARDCMIEAAEMTKRLEVTLGPDTGDLSIRMGISTGQVTAGVMRGERSRFQLFGDTVNTAARMEITSSRNRVHISEATASHLRKYGKLDWIQCREDKVSMKGKGMIQTYWLKSKKYKQNDFVNFWDNSGKEEVTEVDVSGYHDDFPEEFQLTKMERLVEWNVDVLSYLLKQVVAARQSQKFSLDGFESCLVKGSTVLDEFEEIVALPKISKEDIQSRRNPSTITLGDAVMSELREYVAGIAGLYRDNSFHNFEHASHVTASVRKLLSRIVSDSTPLRQQTNCQKVDAADLVGHSYGITSDPLTQFSVVFSAMIHDVDHPGVPNNQLVKEGSKIASKYKEKSVAEQNSVDLAWDLLMEPKYRDLRACIYSNANEMKRFRQLVVNTVMATDICDKELGALRKARWAKAFSETPIDSTPEEDTNRKATIVIEHLIQASDVSHTMQHWQIYRKWNEDFFMECYGAFQAGRAETDPSLAWYKGEIGFFDFYIIPLAKKLENCGVFGVSSHEYLNYATANRDEWVRKGEDIVKEYIEKYQALERVV